MKSDFFLTVAFRYLISKKNEKFISFIGIFSLLGITLGVAALIVVMSVMKGFHREFSKNIIGLGGDINISSANKVFTDEEEIKKKLSKAPYVKAAVPTVSGEALALGKIANSGVKVRGFYKEDLKFKGSILKNVREGSFDSFSGKNSVALGSGLAASLGLEVGDKIKLISPNLISSLFGSIPRSKEFKIVAIFTSGMYDYDSVTVLAPMEAALNFFDIVSPNYIELYTGFPDKSDLLALDLQKILGSEYTITDWKSLNAQFLKALEIERIAMFTILSLIIIVAAFNIISGLFMLVGDKLKDIAIFKTMGAGSGQVMLIFICYGLIIGAAGTLLGVILGVGFATNIENIRIFLESVTSTKIFDAAIYFLYTLPSDVRAEDVLSVSLLSLGLSFCATIYPAYRAANLNPVEILRNE